MGLLRSLGAALRPLLPDLRDLHVYGGAALVVLGAARVYRPAGYLVAGLLLLYLGLRKTS